MAKAHYSYPRVWKKRKNAKEKKKKEGLTLFKRGHFYIWGDHFFGSGGREIGSPEGEGSSTYASSPAFFDSISGLKPRELAVQLREKLPEKPKEFRQYELSMLSIQESFDEGRFRKDTEYDSHVLRDLQGKGLIDIENGLVVPSRSFSEYELEELMKDNDLEIVQELKSWLDLREA